MFSCRNTNDFKYTQTSKAAAVLRELPKFKPARASQTQKYSAAVRKVFMIYGQLGQTGVLVAKEPNDNSNEVAESVSIKKM